MGFGWNCHNDGAQAGGNHWLANDVISHTPHPSVKIMAKAQTICSETLQEHCNEFKYLNHYKLRSEENSEDKSLYISTSKINSLEINSLGMVKRLLVGKPLSKSMWNPCHNVQYHFGENADMQCCETFNIRHAKSQILNVSHLDLQLSLPNPLKPGVKSGMEI